MRLCSQEGAVESIGLDPTRFQMERIDDLKMDDDLATARGNRGFRFAFGLW